MKPLARNISFAAALIALCLALPGVANAQAAKYLILNKDGSGNIVFATTNIKKGEEGKATLKTAFADGDSIYARAYFPGKMGQLQGEEEGFIDIWIDGKHQKRLAFTNKDVPADRDQTLIYVYNTKDYPADFKDDIWNGLSAGKHSVKVVVGKTKFIREGVSVQDQGDRYAIKRDDLHKAVYLSDSSFEFTKK
ncbi:MAG: hypothetical protein HY255_10990 [Betaproteobacteria bacterium]|nr:hypothetical protein [Betaproteobacteria bacterium]